jgi:hypothetical protein
MTARVSEVIRGWLGWCPGRHMVKTANRSEPAISFGTGEKTMKNPGPSATSRPADPWDLLYEHTQQATVIIWSVTAVIVTILITTYLFGPVWFVVLVLCIMVFMLAICSTLTVAVDKKTLTICYGPVRLIRKEWQLDEIVSATVVTNPWYYGYGLRWTPHGPLYNVSGPYAVEILLQSGKKVRIGTDEPETLAGAINHAIR